MDLRPRIVIKLNGAGHYVIPAKDPSGTWRPALAQSGFRGVLDLCVTLAKQFDILIVPGGTSSHLLIDLARELEVDEAIQKAIGCSIIDALGTLLVHALRARLEPGLTVDAISIADLDMLPETGGIFVVRAAPSFLSTDALSVAAAHRSNAQALFLLKHDIPLFYTGLEAPQKLNVISPVKLRDLSRTVQARPGAHYLLDTAAIDALDQAPFRTLLVNPHHLSDIDAYLHGHQVTSATEIQGEGNDTPGG